MLSFAVAGVLDWTAPCQTLSRDKGRLGRERGRICLLHRRNADHKAALRCLRKSVLNSMLVRRL